jgi:hypothetical protein
MFDGGSMIARDDSPQQRALLQDLKDIWRAAGFLAVALTFLALGVSGALAAAFAPAVDLSKVVFGTWPFVISMTLLFLLIMRGSFRNMSGPVGWLTIFVIFTSPYVIAHMTGVAKWHGRTWESTNTGIAALFESIIQHVFSILRYYFVTYGPILTMQAVACAFFLAWALQYKLLPHAQRILQAPAPPSPSK